jgi:hypothetical protein
MIKKRQEAGLEPESHIDEVRASFLSEAASSSSEGENNLSKAKQLLQSSLGN